MDSLIEQFIGNEKIAVVGASRDASKYGQIIYKFLKKCGYQPVPINPFAREIDGDLCYPNLQSIQGEAEVAVICIPPKKVVSVLEDACQSGFKAVWMQPGASTPELVEKAKSMGLDIVSNRCIMVYAKC